MDAEEAAGTGEKGVTPEVPVQINRDQAGLPVMSVDDIRSKADLPSKLQGGPAEQAETLGIVGIILSPFAIEPLAVVKLREVQEVDRHALVLAGAPGDLVDPAPHGNGDFFSTRPEIADGTAHGTIPGDDQAHVMAKGMQGRRQGTNDICEAPGLGKGRRLRCNHEK